MFDGYGRTNARRVENLIRQPNRSHTFLRFNAIAETLVMGPENIYVRRDLSDYETINDFELILRLLLRGRDRSKTSWALYRQEREWDDNTEETLGCVLRYANWDSQAELAAKSWESQAGPIVSMITRYIDPSYCSRLVPACQALDQILVSGISLDERLEDDHPNWHELSVFRMFDWGSVDLAWSNIRSSSVCEAAIFTLMASIEEILREHQSTEQDTIEALEMRYRSPNPETVELIDPSV